MFGRTHLTTHAGSVALRAHLASQMSRNIGMRVRIVEAFGRVLRITVFSLTENSRQLDFLRVGAQ